MTDARRTEILRALLAIAVRVREMQAEAAQVRAVMERAASEGLGA